MSEIAQRLAWSAVHFALLLFGPSALAAALILGFLSMTLWMAAAITRGPGSHLLRFLSGVLVGGLVVILAI